jgi:predicted ferric reductase
VRARLRLQAWGLALLGAGNVMVIVALWWHGGGIGDVQDGASLLTSLGRLTGLLGAYTSLVALLLLARIPLLDRAAGFGRLAAWHRWAGHATLWLLLAHTVLITLGYAGAERVSVWTQTGWLIERFPGLITAFAGMALLVVVAVGSIVIVRRRLRYETWYFVHLYAYLAIVLAFSHQLATGTDLVGDALARGYWYTLYGVTLGALAVFRLGVPAWRVLRHRLRVERVVPVAPGVVSVEVSGRSLDALRARPGQFFTWRFLTRDRWFQAHPFSLSAAPDGRALRITVKDVGDFTAGLGTLHPGTRVVVEGPFGAFTSAARRHERVALIAGGVGITPIRALLEDMPGGPGDIAVVYRALHADDVILRDELDELARRRGLELHYVVGDHRDGDPLSVERMRGLVPDIAARDVYVCGPPEMVAATRASLRAAGVRRIVTERFAL